MREPFESSVEDALVRDRNTALDYLVVAAERNDVAEKGAL